MNENDLYLDYKKRSAAKYAQKIYEPNECSPDIFEKAAINENLKPFKLNMKLEMINPYNLSSICVGSVAKLLRNDYMLVKVASCDEENSKELVCFHRSSTTLLPAGFCQNNSLKLQEPRGLFTLVFLFAFLFLVY